MNRQPRSVGAVAASSHSRGVNGSICIANWNTQWAAASSKRGRILRNRLEDQAPDIVCLTEAYSGLLSGGYEAEAAADHGYPLIAGRRKVTLWSRWPLRSIDRGGNLPFPPGRLIRAVATTPMGDLTIIGVCIPWRDAHVRTGSRDRKPWEDHLLFLQSLRTYLEPYTRQAVVLGDFNQRVPAKFQPPTVAAALDGALAPNFRIASSGLCDDAGSAAIDHLALTADLDATHFDILPARQGDQPLSDHFGWVTEVCVKR